MSAWVIAWIDIDTWGPQIESGPPALETMGRALQRSREPMPAGMGRLAHDAGPVAYLDSVPPRMLMWSVGELILYPSQSLNDLEDFWSNEQPPNGGPIAIVGLDEGQVRSQSPEEVGRALAKLITGPSRSATLGNTAGGAVRYARVGAQQTVTFAWYRNSLSRTDDLSVSDRRGILRHLGFERQLLPGPDAPLQLAGIRLSSSVGADGALITVDFALEPSSVMVLLGRNGAGKSTILEATARATGLARGLDESQMNEQFPSMTRRTADQANPVARVTLRCHAQAGAPDLFRHLLFLFAYSPFAPDEFRRRMPHGREIWDTLQAIDSPEALDPTQLLGQMDLSDIKGAFIDAMLAAVPESMADVVPTLRAVFTEYLSGTTITVDSDDAIAYYPPDSSRVPVEALAIPGSDYVTLINSISSSEPARDALFWAYSAQNVGSAFRGLSTHHPRTGSFYAGWERSPWTEIHEDTLALARRSIPTVVAFDPDPGFGGIELLVEHAVLKLGTKLLRGLGRRGADKNHPFADRDFAPVAKVVANHLGQRASELLPEFARQAGTTLCVHDP